MQKRRSSRRLSIYDVHTACMGPRPPKTGEVLGTPTPDSYVDEYVDRMPTDTAALVTAALGGGRRAREELFRAHWRQAWQRAFTILGRRAAADDVAQESLIHGFANLSQLENPLRFGAWLDRIVVNRCLDLLRREARLVELDPNAADPVDWAGGAETDHDLRRAVVQLSADRRIAVAMRYWLDMTPTEIGEALDLPTGTVNSRLARALADLREILGEADGD
jgi:RNA polymerase sigma-70 factor, ECF subfamily